MRSGYRASRPFNAPRTYYEPKKAATKHDDSGQVFTEMSCPGGPMTADWAWKTRGSSRGAGSFKSLGPGCSSLVNMAIRCALFHSYSITAESLHGVPWEVASHVWQRLIDSQLDSLQIWKIFASAYPLELDATLKRRHQIIDRPNMRFSEYIKPISSPKFDWINFLTLSYITCSRTDLIQISQLPNIGILTIGPGVMAEDIGIDDGIIRSWARIAATSEAFSMLRGLNCRSQKEITHAVFSHLNQFPALALFNMEDCNLGPQHKAYALDCGWKYRTGTLLSDWLVKGGTTGASWDSVMHACFQLGGPFNTKSLTAEGVEAIDRLPRLHLSLGGPPRGAAVDVTGGGSLRSFHRMNPSTRTAQSDLMLASSSSKRPLSFDHIPGAKKTHRKPKMRASKQQNMVDILMGLGG